MLRWLLSQGKPTAAIRFDFLHLTFIVNLKIKREIIVSITFSPLLMVFEVLGKNHEYINHTQYGCFEVIRKVFPWQLVKLLISFFFFFCKVRIIFLFLRNLNNDVYFVL